MVFWGDKKGYMQYDNTEANMNRVIFINRMLDDFAKRDIERKSHYKDPFCRIFLFFFSSIAGKEDWLNVESLMMVDHHIHLVKQSSIALENHAFNTNS